MRRANKRCAGFTLIEFMIVTAISGILVTIAIPRLMGFRSKAMQAEAKSNMGSIFKAQKAVVGELESYTDSLRALKWEPEGELHYIIGFASDNAPRATGINDTAELAAVADISTRFMVHRFGLPLTEGDLPGTAVVSKEAFTIGAAGNVDGDPALDLWTLDDSNNLVAVNDDVN